MSTLVALVDAVWLFLTPDICDGYRNGQTMLSSHSVGTYQKHGLTRTSSGNTRPQSCQLAEPLWTDSLLKSGIGVRELISTLKKSTAEE